MSVKEELHRLVDQLSEEEAGRLLETLRSREDSLDRSLRDAPVDDEPATPDEDEGADDAWQEYLRGEARPWEDVRRELARD